MGLLPLQMLGEASGVLGPLQRDIPAIRPPASFGSLSRWRHVRLTKVGTLAIRLQHRYR
ncbi:hypothetical protein [Microlunatus sp. Gsoil 973]|uniref:hypothetical protein n=1 Tax=Microlunatus sp. Gsoil 973 TaxID=2672569 RepID=UPI0012B45D28|nr:hypothetical protein [Microlunatus sp. Gsoil 973]QGN34438.1 hypothetical protein GJV80_18255 [Microlunatus sp. Gsoil 973]